MSPAARPVTGDVIGSAPVAWFWGEDAWSIDRATAQLQTLKQMK